MNASHRLSVISQHLLVPIEPVVNKTSSLYPNGMLFNQVSIITGSGQGIGQRCAELFAKEGSKVIVTDIDAAKSDAVANGILKAGGTASSFPGDIMDPEFAQRLIEHTIKTFGKINNIINNAGFTWDGVIHKMSDKQWNTIIECHNTAPFRIIRAAAPYLREPAKEEISKGLTPESRCIINISSISGTHGNAGQINYSTAKMGILGLTKTVAKEWGFLGIRCNCIAFGTILTRLTQAQTSTSTIEVAGEKIGIGIPAANVSKDAFKATVPLERAGTVDEAAGSILMLCSPLASYITGQCLEVTGGRSM